MFSPQYISEYKKNLKLATPVVLGQVGHMITQLADTLMVGQIGAEPLASAAFANALFALLLVVVIGLATGITTLVGNAHGANNNKSIVQILGNSFWLLMSFSLILFVLAMVCKPLLYQMGQEPIVVDRAMPYFNILAWSLLPLMAFMSLKHFTDGLEWTYPGMLASIVSNLINIILNYFLIFGKAGLPEMGLLGAGIATLIARVLMALMLLSFLLFHKRLSPFKNALISFKPSINKCKEILKLGVPIATQYFLEGGAFILGAIVIGWLGAIPQAGHQIAISIASFTYMFATGLSSTATIRVSNLVGAKKLDQLPIVSKSLFYMVIFIEVFFALIMILGHETLANWFVKDVEVAQIASSLIVVAAFFQLTDGIQVMAMGALRGLSDVKRPTSIALLSYWIISLPVGYYLMEKANFGAAGIWYGFLTGLSTAAVLLTTRYFLLEHKTVSKIESA
ncbi:MAG: MATE family efflux transporter [Bacteroidia bacterium]